MNWKQAPQRAIKQSGQAVRVGPALLRGHYHRVMCRLPGRKVVIGRRFRVVGPLDIRGSGTVMFGTQRAVFSARLRPTTTGTHSPDGVIRFSNRVLLTRTRIISDYRTDSQPPVTATCRIAI